MTDIYEYEYNERGGKQADEAEFAAWVKDLEFSAGELNRVNELLRESSCEQL